MKKGYLKGILSLTLFMAAFCLFSFVSNAATKWEPEDFTYEPYEKKVYGCDYSRIITVKGTVISGFSEQGESKLANTKKLVIPRTDTNGNKIIGIGEYAFADKGLESVTFPTGMMTPYEDELTKVITKRGNFIIAENAFARNNLTELYLPEGVLAILPNAFQKNNIQTVTFPATIWWIETMAFANNAIENVVFPMVTDFSLEIHGMAFVKNNIKSVRLPDTTGVVNKDVFDGNPGMEAMDANAPSGQVEIGGGIVYMYTDDESLKTKDRIHTDEKTISSQKSWHQRIIVNGDSKYLENPDTYSWKQTDFTYTVDDEAKTATITGLSEQGAQKRSSNKNLILPANIYENSKKYKVTSVDGAKGGGYGLFATESGQIEHVQLPYFVETVGNFVFQNNGIQGVFLPPHIKTIGIAAFQTNALTSVILPDTVNSLGGGAFATNKYLEEISLSVGLTEIADAAFGCSDAKHYMTNLMDIELHEGITKIGKNAFAGNNFAKIEIPSTVQSIGDFAFSSKNYLKTPCTLVLNEGLETIGQYAFRNKIISEVVLPVTVKALKANTFLKEYSDDSEVLITKVYVSSIEQYEDEVNFPAGECHKLCLTSKTNWTAGDFTYTDESVPEELKTLIGSETLHCISGFSESGQEKLVVNQQLELPSVDENKQVVQGISKEAFANKGIESVLFHDSDVLVIGEAAFKGNELSVISVPSSILCFGKEAFAYNQISTLDISDVNSKEAYFGEEAFAYNQLKRLTLPENTKKLHRTSFKNNGYDETNATFSVVELYKNGDVESDTLEYINHPTADDNLYQTLVSGDFDELQKPWGLSDFEIEGTTITGLSDQGQEKMKVNPDLVLPDKNSAGKYIIEIGSDTSGDGVFSVTDSAGKCFVPRSVKLPAKLQHIGNKAFVRAVLKTYETPKMTKISFPTSLKTIGDFAFQNQAFTQISLPDSVTKIGTGCFLGNNNNSTIEKVVLSNKLTEIPASVFGFQKITKVVIPDTVTKIGARAFQGSPITTLVLPEQLTEVGDYAFENHQLTELVLPDSVTSIGKYAFKVYAEGRENTLVSLKLAKSLVSIEKEAFAGSNLTEVELPSTVTKLPSTAFNQSIRTVILKVNREDVESTDTFVTEGSCHKVIYDKLACSGWNKDDFTYDGDSITGFSETGKEKFETNKELVLPDETSDGDRITAIGEEAFAIPVEDVIQQKYDVLSPNGMLAVVLPKDLAEIGKKAFQYNNFKTLDLPKTVTTIGESAFHGNKLEEIVLPEAATQIGGGAFAMNSLTRITLSKQMKKIEQGTFAMNIWMTEIQLPDGLEEIGEEAFAGARLEKLTIPRTVTKIGKKAFHLHRLSTLTIPGNVKEIGESAFEGTYKYASLQTLFLEEGIESIGKYAFKEGLLAEVMLPKSLKILGDEPFLSNRGVDLNGKPSGIVILYSENKEHSIFENGESYQIVTDLCHVAKFGHKWNQGVLKIAPRCKTKGVKTFTCQRCGAIKNQYLAPTHKVLKWKVKKKATVLKKGYKTGTCVWCKKKIKQTIAKVPATIKVSKTSVTLKKGKSITIKTKYKKGDKIKSWKSSNKKVATVSKKGKVKAKGRGTARLVVKLKSGKSAVVTVTVR